MYPAGLVQVVNNVRFFSLNFSGGGTLYLSDGRSFDLSRGSRRIRAWNEMDRGNDGDDGDGDDDDDALGEPVSVAHDGVDLTFYSDRRHVYMAGRGGNKVRTTKKVGNGEKNHFLSPLHPPRSIDCYC